MSLSAWNGFQQGAFLLQPENTAGNEGTTVEWMNSFNSRRNHLKMTGTATTNGLSALSNKRPLDRSRIAPGVAVSPFLSLTVRKSTSRMA
ncbi:hypothetical protein BT69DRAFT_1281487 [Atractiella rhizophila]|nr:hypothetical protein BT69DRAFT_1281487 [Atractiella rhizophila]